MRSRQESSRLFMPRYDQLDSGIPETLDHIEILFWGHTENSVYTLTLKRDTSNSAPFMCLISVSARLGKQVRSGPSSIDGIRVDGSVFCGYQRLSSFASPRRRGDECLENVPCVEYMRLRQDS
jgi:hypothetical protein